MQLGVLVGFLTVGVDVSLTLMLVLGTFFLLLVPLSSLDRRVCAYPYCNLLYHVQLVSLGGLLIFLWGREFKIGFLCITVVAVLERSL